MPHHQRIDHAYPQSHRDHAADGGCVGRIQDELAAIRLKSGIDRRPGAIALRQ